MVKLNNNINSVYTCRCFIYAGGDQPSWSSPKHHPMFVILKMHPLIRWHLRLRQQFWVVYLFFILAITELIHPSNWRSPINVKLESQSSSYPSSNSKNIIDCKCWTYKMSFCNCKLLFVSSCTTCNMQLITFSFEIYQYILKRQGSLKYVHIVPCHREVVFGMGWRFPQG